MAQHQSQSQEQEGNSSARGGITFEQMGNFQLEMSVQLADQEENSALLNPAGSPRWQEEENDQQIIMWQDDRQRKRKKRNFNLLNSSRQSESFDFEDWCEFQNYSSSISDDKKGQLSSSDEFNSSSSDLDQQNNGGLNTIDRRRRRIKNKKDKLTRSRFDILILASWLIICCVATLESTPVMLEQSIPQDFWQDKQRYQNLVEYLWCTRAIIVAPTFIACLIMKIYELGFKTQFVITCSLVLIGTFLRALSLQYGIFTMFYSGYCFIMIALIILLCQMVYVANKWFADNERVLAASVLGSAFFMGQLGAVGLHKILLAQQTSSFNQTPQYEIVLYIQTTALGLGAIAGLILQPSDPVRCPTKVAKNTDIKHQHQQNCKDYLIEVLGNKNLVLTLVVYGLATTIDSSVQVWSINRLPMVFPLAERYKNPLSGFYFVTTICSFLVVLVSLVLSIACIDREKRFNTIIINVLTSFVFWLVLVADWLLYPQFMLHYVVLISLASVICGVIQVLSLSLAAEVSFPLNSVLLSGIFCCINIVTRTLIQKTLTEQLQFVIENEQNDENSVINFDQILTLVLACLTCIMTLSSYCLKEDNRRFAF